MAVLTRGAAKRFQQDLVGVELKQWRAEELKRVEPVPPLNLEPPATPVRFLDVVARVVFLLVCALFLAKFGDLGQQGLREAMKFIR